ncbi:hypothetical protein CKG00_08125 [Morganella morganii]|uniref:HTH cro/C1-type domain-containing protein n=1 Tax=Morganella morganii TaxID=582 RepID=A0A433ZW57_MORMO|nr:helix-turn-helix transcriptional regulator [Morganella morganii]RUT66363.1 hypothetical protein CKG00_08125 [Morganella morganii]
MVVENTKIRAAIETITSEIRESIMLLEMTYEQCDEERVSSAISCAVRSTNASLLKADSLVKLLITAGHYHSDDDQIPTEARTTKSSLPQRLKRAMKAAGLTQKELAERAGVSQGFVSKLATGKTTDSRNIYIKLIADALGVSFGWLHYGTGEMYPTNFSADNREV